MLIADGTTNAKSTADFKYTGDDAGTVTVTVGSVSTTGGASAQLSAMGDDASINIYDAASNLMFRATTSALVTQVDSDADTFRFKDVDIVAGGFPKTITGGAIDWLLSAHWGLTLAANTTITFSNDPQGPATLYIVFTQDAVVPRTVTWPAAVDWPGGAAPVISVGSGARDLITLYYRGGIYYGTFLQNFS